MKQTLGNKINQFRKLVNQIPPTSVKGTNELTASYSSPWDVRTWIIPLPGKGPLQYIFVNCWVGPSHWDKYSVNKDHRLHECRLSILAAEPGQVLNTTLSFPKSCIQTSSQSVLIQNKDFEYSIRGKSPQYSIRFNLPAHGLELDLTMTNHIHPQWWAKAGPFYSHYSVLGKTSGQIRYRGQVTPVNHWVSLEHGRGLNFIPIFTGATSYSGSLFHYELGALENVGVFAMGRFRLNRDSIEPFCGGLFVDQQGNHYPIHHWTKQELHHQNVQDHQGGTVLVPDHWKVEVKNSPIQLRYESDTYWGSSASLIRLCSGTASINAEIQLPGSPPREVKGVVYQEYMETLSK